MASSSNNETMIPIIEIINKNSRLNKSVFTFSNLNDFI